MTRSHRTHEIENVEVLRTKSGAIDYAAYDVRARQERAKTFAATMAFLRKALGSGFAKTAELPAHSTAPQARPAHSS